MILLSKTRYFVGDREIQSIQFLDSENTSVRWSDMSPVEAKVAISTESGVEIYDAITGRVLQTLAQNRSKKPHWSPNGNFIAIELNSNDIAVWNYRSATLIEMIDNPANLLQSSFYRLEWKSDSEILVLTVESNNGVSIYQAEIATGEVIQIYGEPLND